MGAELGRPVKADSLVIAPSRDAAGENCTRLLMVGEDGSRMVIDLDPQSTRQLAECASKASAGEGLSMFTIQPCEPPTNAPTGSCSSVAEIASELSSSERAALLAARPTSWGAEGLHIPVYRGLGQVAKALSLKGLTWTPNNTRLTYTGEAVRAYLMNAPL